MGKNILLIGFMGVGKGALARKIAMNSEKLYAIDTDDLIESMSNTKIKKIFETSGEKTFRALEQKTANWLAKNVTNAVISTGGGFYKVKNIKEIGTVVYLRADFDWILNRITSASNAKKKLKKRPLFQDIKKAKQLFKKRYKAYEEVADIIIDVDKENLESIIKKLLTIVG